MKQGRFLINQITLAVLMTCVMGAAMAVEFNTDVLDAQDKKNIDLSRFSQTGYILPGTYPLRMVLNGEQVGNEIPIPFYVRDGAASSSVPDACLTTEQVALLGLTESASRQLGRWHHGTCVDFNGLKGSSLRGALDRGVLNVAVPQAFLEYSDASWLPPSRWDNGIPGVLLDYNINGTVTKPHEGKQTQYAGLSGTVGANAGAWRLRADYQGSFSHTTGGSQGEQHSLELSRAYLYRPIASLRSTLTLGENYVNSTLFDSWRYTGVALESDERMLPPRLRGYAPEIIGVAQTNAKVTVSQQGRVLYDSLVPAGPFRIQSLDSSVRGQLDVKVTEQNGEVHTFSVSTASVPYLTRPGQIRYKIMAGRPSNWAHDIEGPVFGHGEMSWGVSNSWSVFGGSTLSDDYQSVALGLGRDLFALGTMSFDVTQSVASLPGERRQGKSWRLQYSKRFDDANADITFAGYRFSERDFMTMQQYLDTRYHQGVMGQEKERYQVNVNKSFEGLPFSMGLNYEQSTYWDRGNTRSFGGSAYTYFDLPSLGLRNASLGLTVARSQYLGQAENTVNLSLSLPLGTGYASYSGNRAGNGQYNHSLGYSDRIGNNDNYNLRAGVSQGGGGEAQQQFSGFYTHRGALSEISANVATQQNSYTSVGLSASGGLTVTGEGAALHAGGYNGGTRLMVDTDGVGGVPIDNGRTVTNPWGIGVVTDISSYYRNTTRVDIDELNDDEEATQSVVESVLTEGAIGYRKFGVVKGQRLFAVLSLANGTPPPFGASVMDVKGREMGIVGENGLSWLSGIEPGGRLNVSWDGQIQCQVNIPMKLTGQQLLLPCHQAALEMPEHVVGAKAQF